MKDLNSTFEQYIKVQLAPTLNIVWNNYDMKTPEGEHVKPYLILGGNSPSSIGSKVRENTVGVAMFKIYLKKGKGNLRVYEIADEIKGVFRDQTLTTKALIAGDGGGLPIDGANQKSKLLSQSVNFEEASGPRESPNEGNYVVFILSIAIKVHSIYGVDT